MNEEIIKEAWKEYFHIVEKRLDKYGWYDGSNDRDQKVFDKINITKSGYWQIPTSLLCIKDNVISAVIEIEDEEPSNKSSKKAKVK